MSAIASVDALSNDLPDPVRYPIELGPFPANLHRLGLVTLATDYRSETELRDMLPGGVSLYVTRVPVSDSIRADTLDDIINHLGPAASTLVPYDSLDVIAYACTTGTMVLGEEVVDRELSRGREGVKITTPVRAVREAFRALNIGKTAVITPYVSSLHNRLCEMVHGFGVEVKSSVYFDLEQDSKIVRTPAEEMLRAARDIDSDAIEGLFISCTALQNKDVLAEIEQVIGKPVIGSNQAMIWHSLQLMGVRERRPNLGRLMEIR